MSKKIGLSLDSMRGYDYGDIATREARKSDLSEAITIIKAQIYSISLKTQSFSMPEKMTDAEFLSAKEKQKILKQWELFVRKGFNLNKFTKLIYNHLHLHCGFIAHYDRFGFYYNYWNDEIVKHCDKSGLDIAPVPNTFFEWKRFMQQFHVWGEYTDISVAMLVVLQTELTNLLSDLFNEVKDLYRFEVQNAYNDMLIEQQLLVQGIDELQAEMAAKGDKLKNMTTETHIEQLNSDYTELFGEDSMTEESCQLELAS